MEDNFEFKSRIDLRELNEAVEKIKSGINKIIIGQEKMVELLITAMLANGHVLLEGVPGVAKTLTAKLVAKSVSADFSRIQFTPDLMPSDIIGTLVFNMKHSEFEFKQGPIFSNLILIDEINRSPAKTQAALFESMEERQVTVDGVQYKLDEPFFVVATQNPIEHEGTYRLPEAQLDRFIFKLELGYPTIDDECIILKNADIRKEKKEIDEIQPFLTKKQIIDFREKILHVKVEENLMKYIAEIVSKTRNHHSLYLGGSPRASISIMNCSKALAAIRGRDFITPDDIKEITPHVLKHRIILTPEKEMEGITANEVVEDIFSSIEVPR